MIPVVIPTVPQRREMALELVRELEAQRWASVRISDHVDSRLDVANAVRIGCEGAQDWWIYLEDDVILGPRFGDIPEILKGVDDRHGAVNFFRYIDDIPDWSLTSRPANAMSWSQCVAMRTCDPDQFDSFARHFFAQHPEHYHAPDILLGAWVHHLGERYYAYSPSLIQHREMHSTWKGRSTHRQSPSFERCFGDIHGMPAR